MPTTVFEKSQFRQPVEHETNFDEVDQGLRVRCSKTFFAGGTWLTAFGRTALMRTRPEALLLLRLELRAVKS